MIPRIKGTQDMLDLTLFNWVINNIKHHLNKNHFTEILLPILESTELFKRSLGLETDVVTKEMFTLSSSKEEDSICLRPEATASTMRAFLEHNPQALPWKVYTYGPMFRHERPQKGRFRQFTQCNIEIIGSQNVLHDVQTIALLDRLFQATFLLDSYALIINFLGCTEDRQKFKAVLYDFLTQEQANLCSACLERKEKNILRVFDCKNAQCKTLYQRAPELINCLCTTCAAEWQLVKDQLELLSVSFSYSHTLVRGLDYYDKTVFEFISTNLGAQNAFCSGGRYNHLAEQLGSKKEVPSFGAAIGIERLLLLLEPIQAILPLSQAPILHLILPVETEQQPLALLLADELQTHNLSVDILLENDSLKSMLRKANKIGARYSIIIGSDEQAVREVTVKNMVTSSEERVKQVDLVAYLQR